MSEGKMAALTSQRDGQPPEKSVTVRFIQSEKKKNPHEGFFLCFIGQHDPLPFRIGGSGDSGGFYWQESRRRSPRLCGAVAGQIV
jgi:hypothetical protein